MAPEWDESDVGTREDEPEGAYDGLVNLKCVSLLRLSLIEF